MGKDKNVHIDLLIDQDDINTVTVEKENYICFICFLPDTDDNKEVHIDLNVDKNIKTMTINQENYICFICFLPDNSTDKQKKNLSLIKNFS